jgi:hypothetical protein
MDLFVEHVIFVIDSRNARSRRAVEKIGAELVAGRVAPSSPNSVVCRLDC